VILAKNLDRAREAKKHLATLLRPPFAAD